MFVSIGDVVLEIDFGMGQVLQCGIQVSGVYEGEYVVQVFVWWVDQEVGGGVEVYYVGGVVVDVYFVFDGIVGNCVVFVGVVFGVGQEFWYDEQ